MKKLLDVKNISFKYSEESPDIFKDINFTIDKGDVLCILGPNGTGKTTLLKCLNRLQTPYTGEILLNDKNIKGYTYQELSKYIGYIPQGHIPTFPFNVEEVVLMGRAPYINLTNSPKEEDLKIARKSLKTLNIMHLKDKAYTELSGGERQLVFLARVLCQNPSILILDEPTSNLDFGNQFKLLKIIEKLSSNGLSIIMSTHNPDHGFIVGNKVAIMKDKKFMEYGNPNDVLTENNIEKAYNIDDVDIIKLNNKRKICIPYPKWE
ncbi:iron ABC transporter ATP-binding protein [Methanobrevibacter sp. 87.7]|uniref:ABC transporter ATP-binding protein n=1 Tax=Methanobrevibacter sp. 87.7 TaxID=387957 RepID=UPI000B503A37|nr:ABC transporter ATP-binding protein [Methanobrevibacter sp. 87.7]OWT32642.1 iron ABC transporter ATP-binding protein [Methanobrevibacter sp. 87.7]